MNIEGLRPDELVTLANAKSRLCDNTSVDSTVRTQAWNDFNELVTEIRDLMGDEHVVDNVHCPEQLGDPHGPGTDAWNITDELKSAVRLLIAGVQSELTSRTGMPGKQAASMTLTSIVSEVDDHVDMDEGIYNNFIKELRSIVEI